MPGQNDFQKYLRRNNLIWIIGSGSLDCFPKPGCKDRLCRIARKGGKDKRICASAIFYKDVLFDFGPDVWPRIKNKGVNPKAIVLSHVHFDHIAGLMKFEKLNIPIWTSELHEELFKELGIKANYFKTNEPIELGWDKNEFKIETKIGVHTFTRPMSILKFDKIVYAPDLGQLTLQDRKFAAGIKLWIGDGFNFDKDFVLEGQKLHLSVKKLIKSLDKVKSMERLLLLGIGHHSKWPHEDYELLIKNFAIDNNIHFITEIGWDNLLMKAPTRPHLS